ncbi:MAG: hypothetical protein AAGJ93_16105, partial [Bacteroidota bacterium]
IFFVAYFLICFRISTYFLQYRYSLVDKKGLSTVIEKIRTKSTYFSTSSNLGFSLLGEPVVIVKRQQP